MHGVIRRSGFPIAFVGLTTFAVALASTSFFIVRSVLVHPIPIAHADRIVVFSSRISSQDYRTLAAGSPPVAQVAAVFPKRVTLEGKAGRTIARAAVITPNLFDVLGVTTMQGRGFAAHDQGAVAVVSHDVWRQQVVGPAGARRVRVGQVWHDVIGVLPADFRGMSLVQPVDVWVPFTTDPSGASILSSGLIPRIPQGGWLVAIARLSDATQGVAVNERFLSVLRQSGERRWQAAVAPGALTESLRDAALPRDMRAGVRRAVAILVTLTILVVGVSLVSILTLTGLHVLDRKHEFAVRLVLGASPRRLAGQVAVEYGRLGALAGVLSLWPTFALLNWLSAVRFDRFMDTHLSFEVGPSFVAGAVIGATLLGAASGVIWLAVSLGRGPAALRTEAATIIGGGARRLLACAAAGQVALALSLMIPAGLLGATFRELTRSLLGFDPQHVVWASVELSLSGEDEATVRTRLQGVTTRALQLPGVTDAGWSTTMPLGWVRFDWPISSPVMVSTGHDTANIDVAGSLVDAHYFSTLGIRTLSGTLFSDTAVASEVVVNRAFVERLTAGRDVLGHTLTIDGQRSLRIVGVVENSKYFSFDEAVEPHLYLPFTFQFQPIAVLFVKANGDAERLVEPIRRVIRDAGGMMPVSESMTMSEHLDLHLARIRLLAASGALFALGSLAVAIVGVFSIVRHSVASRRREIAVRLALGGTRARVCGGVALGNARWIGVGVLAGLAGAWGCTRLVREQLVDVGANDAALWALSTAIVLGASLAATAVPATRAARLDPARVLRER